jgi:hypothetical protein
MFLRLILGLLFLSASIMDEKRQIARRFVALGLEQPNKLRIGLSFEAEIDKRSTPCSSGKSPE